MDYFDKLANKIKTRGKNLALRSMAYFKRLLFPLYLFPVKLATYSLFYLVKFLLRLLLAVFGLMIDCVVFPFKSLKNFLKSIVLVVISLYLLVSLFVIGDYIRTQYGWFGKFLCSFGVKDKLQNSVVRVVGGYSEGSGFFISGNEVITNFHIIADEPSPKIIFPDGSFVTPIKIYGNKDVDLAVLLTEKKYPDKVLALPDMIYLLPDEPLISTGYALGTSLAKKGLTYLAGNI